MDPQVIVGEAVAGRAASVRRNLRSLVSGLNTNTFDLAALLFEAREGNYFSAWGFSSLAEYAQKELGLKQRKAEYLTRIMKVTKAVGLKREQVEQAGISKLRDITTLDPGKSFWNTDTKTSESLAEHVVNLVLDAPELTVEEVREKVLRLQGRLGPDRPVTHSYTVPRSAYDNVIKAAIEKARMVLGSQGRDADGNAQEYGDGPCLEVICANFLSDPSFEEEPLPEEEEVGTIEIPMEEI